MTPIVFDLDGTLIDSAPDIHAAVNGMLSEVGQPALDLPTVISFIGNGVGVLTERVIAHCGLRAQDHADLLARLMRHYTTGSAKLTRLYPGVKTTLTELADKGVPMAVCTNKPVAPALHILQELDLADFMGCVIGGDSCPTRKPNPEMLHRVLEKLGTDRCIYVGDSEVDAATAQAAGVPFMLFTEGYRKTPVAQIPHTTAFDHWSDFTELLPS